MSDYNQYVAVTDPAPVASSGSGWFWIILLIIIIIIIVVIVVVVLIRRRNQNELDITNVVFIAPNATTIRATWTGVSNSNDQVIMYVYKTGTPINFNSDGTPKVQSDVTAQSPIVNGNTTFSTQATVPAGNVTYTAVLIVTNPNIVGHGQVTSKSLVPRAASGNPTGVFHLQANGQHGEVSYTLPGTGPLPGVATVGYNFTGSTTADNNLFYRDSNGLICTVMLSQTGAVNFSAPTNLCTDLGSETYILYDTGTSSSSGIVVNGPIVITNGVPTINGVRVTTINGNPVVVTNNNTVTVNGTPVVFSNGFLTINGVRVTTINNIQVNGGTTTVVNGVIVPTTTTVNGTGTGRLGIKRIDPANDPSNANARWNYDSTTNRWCLMNAIAGSNTTGSNNSRCMELPTSVITPLNQNVPINVGANGTTWNNINFSLSSS